MLPWHFFQWPIEVPQPKNKCDTKSIFPYLQMLNNTEILPCFVGCSTSSRHRGKLSPYWNCPVLKTVGTRGDGLQWVWFRHHPDLLPLHRSTPLPSGLVILCTTLVRVHVCPALTCTLIVSPPREAFTSADRTTCCLR